MNFILVKILWCSIWLKQKFFVHQFRSQFPVDPRACPGNHWPYTCVWGEQRGVETMSKTVILVPSWLLRSLFCSILNCTWEKGWVEAFQHFVWELRLTGIEKDRLWKCCAGSHVEQAFDPSVAVPITTVKLVCRRCMTVRAMIPRESSRWGVSVQPPPCTHTHVQALHTCALTHGRTPSHEELEWMGALSSRAGGACLCANGIWCILKRVLASF